MSGSEEQRAADVQSALPASARASMIDGQLNDCRRSLSPLGPLVVVQRHAQPALGDLRLRLRLLVDEQLVVLLHRFGIRQHRDREARGLVAFPFAA